MKENPFKKMGEGIGKKAKSLAIGLAATAATIVGTGEATHAQGNISPTKGIYNDNSRVRYPPEKSANQEAKYARVGGLSYPDYQTHQLVSIENHPLHLTDARAVRKTFDGNVTMVKTDGDMVRGMTYEEWNRYSDKLFKEEDVQITSYAQYEKERQLQQLLGYGKEGIKFDATQRKNVMDGGMIYFRKLPARAALDSISANYFFYDFKDIVNRNPGNISEAEVQDLMNSGILDKDFTFVYREKLLRLVKAYKNVVEQDARTENPKISKEDLEKLIQLNSQPFDDENLEDFVERLTQDVHQANDGTLFVLEHKDGKKSSIRIRIGLGNILNGNNINPRFGMWRRY